MGLRGVAPQTNQYRFIDIKQAIPKLQRDIIVHTKGMTPSYISCLCKKPISAIGDHLAFCLFLSLSLSSSLLPSQNVLIAKSCYNAEMCCRLLSFSEMFGMP